MTHAELKCMTFRMTLYSSLQDSRSLSSQLSRESQERQRRDSANSTSSQDSQHKIPRTSTFSSSLPLLYHKGSRDGSVGSAFNCEPMCCRFESGFGAEYVGFTPSALRLGNQRPWYVQPCLCDWTYKRSHATYRKEKGIVHQWLVSS